jgi:hypothetical protein
LHLRNSSKNSLDKIFVSNVEELRRFDVENYFNMVIKMNNILMKQQLIT